jgi:multimeric flavodoxin WrbA
MTLLMISGSRNPEGKTATMADALLRGASGAGCQCERVFLPELTIERCRQCDQDGWGDCRKKGQCIIEDDLDSLVGKIREADAVAFANPVYFSDLSESMRAFLDRLRRILRHESAKPGIEGKPAVGMCVAGGGGGGAAACCVSMEKVLRTCRFDVKDLIACRRQNMDLKEQILESTGRWLASQSDG